MKMLCSAFLGDVWQVFVFVVVPLGIAVGAVVLWRRTRHVAVLLQAVGAGSFFVCCFLDRLRSFVNPFDRSLVSRIAWAKDVQAVTVPVAMLAFIVFGTGYFWYAISRKNI